MSERAYEYLVVDVFTEKAFEGNPLAVFPDAAGLSGEEMQTLARELNLSETSFVFAPSSPQAAAKRFASTNGSPASSAGKPSLSRSRVYSASTVPLAHVSAARGSAIPSTTIWIW